MNVESMTLVGSLSMQTVTKQFSLRVIALSELLCEILKRKQTTVRKNFAAVASREKTDGFSVNKRLINWIPYLNFALHLDCNAAFPVALTISISHKLLEKGACVFRSSTITPLVALR